SANWDKDLRGTESAVSGPWLERSSPYAAGRQRVCCRSQVTMLRAPSATFVPAAGGATPCEVDPGREGFPPPLLRATAATRPATAAATSTATAARRRAGHRVRGPAGRARISVARCSGSGGRESVSASEATGASSRASAAAVGGLFSGRADRHAVTAATGSGGVAGT